MADTVAITAGSGTSIATDDVGGVHYQRIKRSVGGDGSATDFLDKVTRQETFTTTADGTAQDVSAQGFSAFALQVKQTGTVTSWTVAVQVSLDGTNYVTILSHTKAGDGDAAIVFSGPNAYPALYFRASCTAITLGGGTNVVATVVGDAVMKTITKLTLWTFAAGLVAGSLFTLPGTAQTVPTTAVTQSGTWNLTNISGTVSLPTGAATAANQTTIAGHVDGLETLIGTTNTSLSTIDGRVDGIEALLTTIDADTGNLAAIAASLSVLDDTAGEVADEYVTVRLSDGSSFLTVASDGTVGSAIGTSGPLGTAVYADFDGSAIPTITNVDTEGELVPVAASIKGVQYTMLVSEDGSLQYGTTTTPLVVDLGANNDVTVTGTVTATATNLDVQIGGSDTVAVSNAGTFATQVNGAALTALQLIDDIVGVEDAAETAGGGLARMGAVRRDTAASSAGTAGDNATINTDSLGRLWQRDGNPCADHARITTAAISTSSSGNVEIVALNGSDLIYVCGYSVVAGAATGVQLIYGTGTACATGETDLTGVWSFAANGGITQSNGGVPQFVVPAGNAFCVENSGANAIAGHVTYVRTAAP